MIEIQSYVKQAAELVAVGEFTGPIADEDYVEGAIELTVNRKPLLTREQVDYVDQLWAYLVEGLQAVVAGQSFSTYFPDTPIKLTLTPNARQLHVVVERKNHRAEATSTIDEWRTAVVPAAIGFFERMLPLMPNHRAGSERLLKQLRALA